jgi:hypothetical protein
MDLSVIDTSLTDGSAAPKPIDAPAGKQSDSALLTGEKPSARWWNAQQL